MKKSIFCLLLFMLGFAQMKAEVEFTQAFQDSTMRLDYILAGTDKTTAIYFDEVGYWDGWAGRRHHLQRPFLSGNGSVTLRDHATGDTIYTNTFSNIFQEWQVTSEAKTVARSFETTFLVPFPRNKVDVTIAILNNRHEQVAELTHTIDPSDKIMMRHIPTAPHKVRYVHQGGDLAHSVDVILLGEGYTPSEEEKFWNDASLATETFLAHEPFDEMKDRFNFLAVFTPADESGPDVPREGIWSRTAHRTHYDTFYTDRYLTTQAIHNIFDDISGFPFEHVVLLVNTERYGGGGFFNQITIATSDHRMSKPVLVHEFGHAYGGLGDEYNYANENADTYPLDVEPWEPNITTMVDFKSKWSDLLPSDVAIPTPTPKRYPANSYEIKADTSEGQEMLNEMSQTLGVFEGAGYRAQGIYRPVHSCRMRENIVPRFCPVCCRSIRAITDWYTK